MVLKTCIDCKQAKPLDEFPKGEGAHGKHAYCKPCNVARVKAWRIKNKERVEAYEKDPINRRRASDVQRRRRIVSYGLTPERVAEILLEQGGACAGCGRLPQGRRKHLSIDHCHDTGVVRGLLCDDCNKALGFVHDSVEVLLALVAYLERAREGEPERRGTTATAYVAGDL